MIEPTTSRVYNHTLVPPLSQNFWTFKMWCYLRSRGLLAGKFNIYETFIPIYMLSITDSVIISLNFDVLRKVCAEMNATLIVDQYKYTKQQILNVLKTA